MKCRYCQGEIQKTEFKRHMEFFEELSYIHVPGGLFSCGGTMKTWAAPLVFGDYINQLEIAETNHLDK